MWLSAAIFVTLACALLIKESRRRPDLLSIVIIIYSLQIILPGIFLPILLSLPDHDVSLGNPFFDRVYNEDLGVITALTAALAAVFLLALYAGYHLPISRWRMASDKHPKRLTIVSWRLYTVVLTGLILMSFLLYTMPGQSLGDKYFSLILFRAQHASVDEIRNFVTANLFSLAQTFAICSVLLLAYYKDKDTHVSLHTWVVIIALILFLASVAVSRRMLLIQALIIYFTCVLVCRRWFLKYIVIAFPLGVLWLGYGEEVLWQIPNVVSGDEVKYSFGARGLLLPVVRAFSSLGISLNSSWATLLFMDSLPPRFGTDHILSALRFLPLGIFGINELKLYGPRVVRLSTEAFVDKHALDIPPGLIGQMWIDFRVLGPIAWGLLYGAIVRILQNGLNGFERTWTSCGVYAVLVFVVALPINTGSLDFNFSVDMFVLLLALWWVSRSKVAAVYTR